MPPGEDRDTMMIHAATYLTRVASASVPSADDAVVRLWPRPAHTRREPKATNNAPPKNFEATVVATLLRHMDAAQPAKTGLLGMWYPHAYEAAARASGQALPQDGWTGYANPRFFVRPQPHQFRVRAYQSASTALDAFFAGPTIADCGSAIAAAHWQVVRHTLGDAKFDAVFGSASSPTPEILRMHIGKSTLAWEPLSYFVDWGPAARARRAFDKSQAKRGDLYHIQGVAHYQAKHPDGSGCGYNVLYAGDDTCGEPLFVGFDLQPACTEQQIRALLQEQFNAPRNLRALAYIKHSPYPGAYDLQAMGLPTMLPTDETHTVGLLPTTQRRLRFDRLWRARRTAAATLAQSVEQVLTHRQAQLSQYEQLR